MPTDDVSSMAFNARLIGGPDYEPDVTVTSPLLLATNMLPDGNRASNEY
jgi:hypothetical protein